jgi:hypothetical protein
MIKKWIDKFRNKNKTKNQRPEIPWIQATNNPWGVPILDVRPLTHSLVSTSSDIQCATNAISYNQEDGSCFVGQKPPLEKSINTNILYAKDRVLANGPIFIPSKMEHKWAIFCYENNIICVRSWIRKVFVLANVDQSGENICISSLTGSFDGNEYDDSYHLSSTFDYLIRSHAMELPFPVPISEEIAEDPYAAAMWCFSCFGDMAMFATPYKIETDIPAFPLRSHSLLHISVARGDRTEINRQLENGIPIDLLAADGMSPMHWALAQDDISILKYLIDCGSPVDTRSDQGATPLMTASQADDIDKVIFLLDQGADPNAVDDRGFTAIHRTSEMGKVEMTKLLLNRGANRDVEAEGFTPLKLARARGNNSIIQILNDS